LKIKNLHIRSAVGVQHLGTTVENISVIVAAIPGLWSFVCWARRSIHAQKMMNRIKKTNPQVWNQLPTLGRLHSSAGVDLLVTKGLIQGPEVNKFLEQDEYLEKSTWLGLLISAVLLFLVALLKFINAALN
jgi:hypothetical protein